MIKILIIEDEENLRNGLRDILQIKGYSIIAAADGMEGISMAKQCAPSLIICDVMMPKLDGFQLKEIINNDKDISTIPFIFLTARSEMESLREGMNLGADDYIIKPYKVPELLRVIETRLKRHNEVIKKVLNEKEKSKSEKKSKKYSDKDRLFINLTNATPKVLKIGNIKCIEASGSYSIIYMANGQEFIYRKSIKSWQESLNTKTFLRIHRSVIINKKFISKISKWSSSTYLVYLKGIEKPFQISQRYAIKIRSQLKL